MCGRFAGRMLPGIEKPHLRVFRISSELTAKMGYLTRGMKRTIGQDPMEYDL